MDLFLVDSFLWPGWMTVYGSPCPHLHTLTFNQRDPCTAAGWLQIIGMLAPHIDILAINEWEPIEGAIEWLRTMIKPPAICKASFNLLERHPDYSLLPGLKYLELQAFVTQEDWSTLATSCPELKELKLELKSRRGLTIPNPAPIIATFPDLVYFSARLESTNFRARRCLRMVLINTNFPKLRKIIFSTYGLTERDMDDVTEKMGQYANLFSAVVEFRSESGKRTPSEFITSLGSLCHLTYLAICNRSKIFSISEIANGRRSFRI